MRYEGSAHLDKPWTRSPPATVARGIVIRGIFGPIIDAYARQEIIGDEHLAHLDGPAIFVANHCSHLDTPALLRSLPARRRRRTAVAAAVDYFYAKPVLAIAVSLAFGTVPVDRSSRGEGARAVADIEHLLGSGWSLVVFAEGTRSRDGRVGIMRSGAATLAARHEVPIVPVHISGTHSAMPPGCRWIVRPRAAGQRIRGQRAGGQRTRHMIRVSFGAPIQVRPDEERLEVMERVRLFMAGCGADTTPDPRLRAHRAMVAEKAAGKTLATHSRA